MCRQGVTPFCRLSLLQRLTHDVTDQLIAYRDSIEAALAGLDEHDDIAVDFDSSRHNAGWYWLFLDGLLPDS